MATRQTLVGGLMNGAAGGAIRRLIEIANHRRHATRARRR